MKSKTNIVFLIFAVMFSMQGFTQDDELTVFQAGQPARADEVNQNFEILSDRIGQSGSGALQVTLGYNATAEVGRVRITDVGVNGGPITGTVAPGSTVTVTLNGTIYATTCPGCVYQVLVGFAGETRADCIFSGTTGTQGNPTRFNNRSFNIEAPSSPGVYYLTFDSDAEFNCEDALAKQADSSTDPSRRFAVLTVQ